MAGPLAAAGRALVSTWRELLAERDRGLARALEVSNYSLAQLDELTAATGVTPQVNQIPWAPTRYDPALLAEHRRRGVVVGGLQPLQEHRPAPPGAGRDRRRPRRHPAQVVVRWHVDHQVVVIPKSASPERVAANFDVFGFSLTEEELTRIDGLSVGRRR